MLGSVLVFLLWGVLRPDAGKVWLLLSPPRHELRILVVKFTLMH